MEPNASVSGLNYGQRFSFVFLGGRSQDGGAKGQRFPLNETPSSGRNMKKIEWMPSTRGASIKALPICSNMSPGGSAILEWTVGDAGAIFLFSALNVPQMALGGRTDLRPNAWSYRVGLKRSRVERRQGYPSVCMMM